MSGTTERVSRAPPAHIIVLEVDPILVNHKVNARIERRVRKAMRQLPDRPGAVVVPVISLLNHPHDQAAAVRFVRELFTRHPRWTRAGGVVLVTAGYATEQTGPTGLTPMVARLVPIANPNAPAERRLSERVFNRDTGAEALFDEWPAFQYVERLDRVPATELVEVRADGYYIDGIRFGPLSSSRDPAPFALLGVMGPKNGPAPSLRLRGKDRV